MSLPIELADTVATVEGVAADLTTLQTAIDALTPAPATDDLVTIIQSLKDIAATLQSNTATFMAVIRTVRING